MWRYCSEKKVLRGGKRERESERERERERERNEIPVVFLIEQYKTIPGEV